MTTRATNTHPAALGAVLPLVAALAACSPVEGRLPLALQSFADKAAAPLDRNGTPLGSADATALEDATRAFVNDRVAAPPVDTSEPFALSLETLRSTVLERNLDLRVVELSPRIADERVNEERAKFDAVFTASAAFRDEDKDDGNTTLFGLSSPDPLLAGAVGAFTELAQEREQFEAGVGLTAPLPTGGRAGLSQTFEIDDKSARGLVSTEDRGAFKFSLSQPLLRGAGVAVNTASIRLARLSAAGTQASAKLATIRVLASAEKAYWRLYGARRALDVRREQLRLAADNAALVGRRIEEGLTAPVERFAADLAVAQQLEAVVQAETTLRLQARELARILNTDELPIDRPRPIEPTSDPALVRYELDAAALAERGVAERLDLLGVELDLAADALRVDLARNAVLPAFVVDFEYGLGSRDGSLASAFDDQFSFNNQAWAVGARASIPVTNDAAEARLRGAMLGRLQRLATREQRTLAIRQEVHDAVDVMNQNWFRILAARQNVVAATGNFEAEQQLLSQGIATAQDVLIALQQLGDARIREVGAIVAYRVAQIDLAFATGTLLGYAGTELDPGP